MLEEKMEEIKKFREKFISKVKKAMFSKNSSERVRMESIPLFLINYIPFRKFMIGGSLDLIRACDVKVISSVDIYFEKNSYFDIDVGVSEYYLRDNELISFVREYNKFLVLLEAYLSCLVFFGFISSGGLTFEVSFYKYDNGVMYFRLRDFYGDIKSSFEFNGFSISDAFLLGSFLTFLEFFSGEVLKDKSFRKKISEDDESVKSLLEYIKNSGFDNMLLWVSGRLSVFNDFLLKIREMGLVSKLLY